MREAPRMAVEQATDIVWTHSTAWAITLINFVLISL